MGLCNVRPYVKNSTFQGCFEGITSHGGSFEAKFDGNNIIDCWDDGIFDRSYMSIITNNTISKSTSESATKNGGGEENYGIIVGYGGRRTNVSTNTIRGFFGAFQVRSSGTSNWQYNTQLIDIHDNVISGCFLGLKTEMNGSENSSNRFTSYRRNQHSYMGRFIVYLDEYSAGFCVQDNTLDGDFRYDGTGTISFVYADGNCPNLKVSGNEWNRTKGGNSNSANIYMASVGSISDILVYPEIDWAGTTKIYDNDVAFMDEDNVKIYVGSINYNQNLFADKATNTDTKTIEIVSGEVAITPDRSRVTYIKLMTEGGVANDDLDIIKPTTGTYFKEGDILYIRQSGNVYTFNIRDINSSGALSFGFQTKNNESITTSSANEVIQLVFMGSHWAVVSAEVSTS